MDDKAPLYVTTAIPFVNAPPHVGFAYEAVLADVLARHARLRGVPVRLQAGTDDNSLKNVRAAERAGIPTAELVARHADRFQALAPALDLSYDDFLRTSVDPRHRPGVEALWRACAAAGDLYKRRYRGRYCVGCEHFLADADLDADGRCPEHRLAPEAIEEENWFFRLSRHRERLARLIEDRHLAITPASRRNEVLAFLASGLEDVSVSRARARARGWGIPVPGDPEQVIYVWFDALGSYLTALGWPADTADYRRFWAGAGRRVHVIGKGIVRFHAVYWPAFLLSAGLPLPTDLLVHGYLTVEGRKIGKSLGNAIDPEALVARHGIDPVRHLLLRHLRPFEDGDFSEPRLRAARDADLADQLGNLVRRTIVLWQRHSPAPTLGGGGGGAPEAALRARAAALPGAITQQLDRFAIDEAVAPVFDLVAECNRYLEATAPWTVARAEGSRARLDVILQHALEAVRIVAVGLAPFLPGTARAIGAQLGQPSPDPGGWAEAIQWGGRPWVRDVPGGPVLFAKDENATVPASSSSPSSR